MATFHEATQRSVVTRTGGTIIDATVSDLAVLGSVTDGLTSGSINLSVWSPSTAGSGSVTATDTSLVFDTGASASSFAQVDSLPGIGALDTSFEVEIDSLAFAGAGGAADYIGVVLQITDGSATQGLRCLFTRSGASLEAFGIDGRSASRVTPLTASSASGPTLKYTLRIAIRSGLFWAWIDHVEFLSAVPGLASGTIQFVVSNQLAGSRLQAKLVDYTAKPMATFGGEYVNVIDQLAEERLRIETPPLQKGLDVAVLTVWDRYGDSVVAPAGFQVEAPLVDRVRQFTGSVSLPVVVGTTQAVSPLAYPDGQVTSGTPYDGLYDPADQLILAHLNETGPLREQAQNLSVDENSWLTGAGTITKGVDGPFGVGSRAILFDGLGGIAIGAADGDYPAKAGDGGAWWTTFWVYQEVSWSLIQLYSMVSRGYLGPTRTYNLVAARGGGLVWAGRFANSLIPAGPNGDASTPSPVGKWIFVFASFDQIGADGYFRLWIHWDAFPNGLLRRDPQLVGLVQDWSVFHAGSSKSPWLVGREYALGPAVPIDMRMAEFSLFQGSYPGDAVRQEIYDLQTRSGTVQQSILGARNRRNSLTYRPPRF